MQRCWGNSSSHCTWYLLSYYLYAIYNFLCFFLYFFDLVLACPQNFSILLVAQFFCWLQLCSGLRTRAIKAIKNQQQHPKIYIVPQNLRTSLHKIELSLWSSSFFSSFFIFISETFSFNPCAYSFVLIVKDSSATGSSGGRLLSLCHPKSGNIGNILFFF